MGAVQSGKTASMLGVTAMSLDAGVEMIVILAGTRIALWRQTMGRLLDQLDGYDESSSPELARRRVLVPDPVLATSEGERPTPVQLYAVSRAKARRALSEGRPIVAVVMKHPQHLRAMATVIRESLMPSIESRGKPFHLVVLDDEADDGSILDASSERSLDPAVHHLKAVPRAIVDLWAARPHSDRTASPRLFATYVGYTATPQANLLQSDHNPLAPSDFVAALRTPYDRGPLQPRWPTYQEPSGLSRYFTGGETFYRELRNANVVRSSPGGDVAEAVRAFLVAGAIRLWGEHHRLRPSEARRATFSSRAEALERSSRPHSMLFHPSAAVADHFRTAAGILEEVSGLDAVSARRRIEAGERGLPVDEVARKLAREEESWRRWLLDYAASATAVQDAFGLPRRPPVPAPEDWPVIRNLLLEEIIPNTSIKVVNSDPAADDRPLYDPVQGDRGEWAAPPDLVTIFVSGNVMSRGLTLEGLTTTMFERQSDDPYADTQMQMQRWFGYRGEYLHLCRLFAPAAQLALFEAYHDTDEALRRSVIDAMSHTDQAPSPYVLQGQDFSATGKLTNVANVPLCPGAAPFVRLVNSGVHADPNVEVVAAAFRDRLSEDIDVKGLVRGRIITEPLSLEEAADLLDELRYDDYRPTRDGWEGRRWVDLEAKVGIDPTTDVDAVLPFFRPPDDSSGSTSEYARGGPYAISAYLRLWRACLTRRARGLVATDDPTTPWSMLDLAAKARQQPKFYIGLRYGSGLDVTDGPLGALPFRVRAMKRAVTNGELEASWGTRNPRPGPAQYLGDELFDYHLHGGNPPSASPGEPLWRPQGSPGLILFHVIEQEDQDFPTVAFGAAIPLGGPDQFAARKPPPSAARSV